MVSDYCYEVCSAILRQFSAATGAVVRLWTRSGILKKKSFSYYYTASADAAKLPGVCNLNEFSIATIFLLGVIGRGGLVHN